MTDLTLTLDRAATAATTATTAAATQPNGTGGNLDIQGTADRVADMLKNGQTQDATTLLDNARRDQPREVQDALDRVVGSRINQCYVAPQGSPVEVGETLRRLDMATVTLPARPDPARMATIPETQRHDIYRSILETRGDQASQDALANGDRVIVGLRTETPTTTNRGTGAYDDTIAVLWRGADGTRHVAEFSSANTEPTAQYDGAYRNNPAVDFRRTDGQDGNGDGSADLGRLSPGTYALRETTHRNPASAGTNFSLRPTADAVAAGAGRVQRDTNHDGVFDDRDPQRFDALNDTFKIHSGSRNNRDSAGCQTIAPGDFQRFADTVRGGSQTTWQYVLSDATAPR